MKHKAIARMSGAAAMASAMTFAGLTSPTHALAATGQLEASVTRVGGGDTVLVDVNPNRLSGFWSFQVQELAKSGTWSTQCATWATQGTAETRSLQLAAGTYRVVVQGKDGWTATTSARVTLTGTRAPGMPTGLRPAAPAPAKPSTETGGGARPGLHPGTVRVSANAAPSRSRFVVDVDPDLGKRSWRFRVQVQRADGTWAFLKKTYRTKGNAETRSVNLRAGTYRAVVPGDHGYRGSTTGSVVLVK